MVSFYLDVYFDEPFIHIAQSGKCCTRKINGPAFNERATIIDANGHRIGAVGAAHHSPERVVQNEISVTTLYIMRRWEELQ